MVRILELVVRMATDRTQINRKIKARLRPKPKEEAPDRWYLSSKCGIDIDALEWMFRSLRITRRDAFLDIDGFAIRLVHLFDPSSQTSRRKLKAEHYFVIPEFKDDPKKAPYRISKQDIVRELRKLDARYESAAQGQLVCKRPLTKVIVHFNTILKEVGKKHRDDFSFLYGTSNARARLIAAWVNWFFKAKYGIESTYKPEQIRKLIEPARRRSAK